MLMVFGVGALPAAAETRERAATAEGSDITQALVVGGGAFALIIALAGAVLFYTAKGRRL
ncbi:hypothetical protein DI005_35790 [Prauserella sp. PE36]|uniref:LPXTG cell wall anchor domain-containing protein n=2 Tax=Pseudonocardiaceae TaxID=2070 RepID=A0ABY2RUU8_9PSEU|nr:hypothetical protein [Prauserella sp. PE36]PXY26838.1 hypothetical protein BAY59_18220 [Prauserella coralliicola]RBM10722.1 hypothetical protein DI005_35790 [Prauserella sp. PE36]TKG61369.1 hypothetical protein FCN18_33675 [Prauserella endophytica]